MRMSQQPRRAFLTSAIGIAVALSACAPAKPSFINRFLGGVERAGNALPGVWSFEAPAPGPHLCIVALTHALAIASLLLAPASGWAAPGPQAGVSAAVRGSVLLGEVGR